MRRHSPPYYSSRRGYNDRGRSPPRRKSGGYSGGHKEQNGGSLLVRNIPLNCRPEDLRVPFERYGRVRDVYLPRDYYSGQPRGFAFVEFVDPNDASEAQYHMDRQRFGGRDITVVLASERRKRPEDMRHRARVGGPSHYDGHRSSRYGRSRSCTRSRSRSPHHHPSRARQLSRKHPSRSKSPRDYHEGREEYSRRSYSPEVRRRADDDGHGEKAHHDGGEGRCGDLRSPSPRRASRSPSGSRSRSANLSPGQSR